MRYVKYKSYDMANIMRGHEAADTNNNLESNQVYDNIGEFIERYEEKIRVKKKKRKDKQEENAPDVGLVAFMEKDDEIDWQRLHSMLG